MDVLAKRSNKAFDLGPGEPQEVFKALRADGCYCVSAWSRYPAIGGDPGFIRAIREFLSTHGYPSGGNIVVTNGAKQALGATLYAMYREQHARLPSVAKVLSHWGPYWPTLKSIAELHGWKVVADDTEFPEHADIVTSPNNPDGRLAKRDFLQNNASRPFNATRPPPYIYPIWDAAYASPAYGWDGFCVPSRVQVYSMAKLFGLPGLRVGWIHTEDNYFAELMSAYVEVQTSGVNQDSQISAQEVLDKYSDVARWHGLCRDIRRRLKANRLLLEKALGSRIERRDAGEGMYMFFGAPPARRNLARVFERLDVGYVGGQACGLDEKHLYRLNLAQDTKVVAALARALRKELQ